MFDTNNAIIVLALIESLRDHQSWCGETHLQKAMYFAKHQCGLPVDFSFILYKHGPYSFDFHDTLGLLFAHCLIEHEITPPYGPRICLSETGKDYLQARKNGLSANNQDIMKTVAQWFGSKGVKDLEKLATALWVRKNLPKASENELAQKINKLKPHISIEEGLTSLQRLHQLTG